jgi:hypothetical protein
MTMELAAIAQQYQTLFTAHYATRLLPSHRHALDALTRCRTPAAGEVQVRCMDCAQVRQQALSCGHRSCPKCQNHEATQWLDRQQAKLLPVEYFMITFTLPSELRPLAWQHQHVIYTLLFDCVSSTLKDFGLTPKNLGADIGMTAVLHTHTRRLEYHPHIHVVVPGGGIDTRRRQWKKKKGKYLFNAFALAKVFRARFLAAVSAAGLATPDKPPHKWVVDCTHVGKGLPALQYLSRYLYRGVISENNIIENRDGQVTFRFTDSHTGATDTRTVNGEDFLWLVLQHVLPKGFRRVRDYGFLHGNARQRLSLVQLVLRVMIERTPPRRRPSFTCPHCQAPMTVVAVRRAARRSG